MSKHYGAVPVKAHKSGVQHAERGCIPCTGCCVVVPQDKFYAVERFGRFDRILNPGLAFAGFDLCNCCISFRSISSRVEQNNCTVDTKTKDNVFVAVHVAVQQAVVPKDVQSALYKLDDVDAQVDAYVSDVVRSELPKMTLDEAFENKDALSKAIEECLGQHMSDYGFQIKKALVTEVRPSQSIMTAMDEINKQKRLREATRMAAEADKIKLVMAAEAEAEAAKLQGEGIAKQRAAIVEGLKTSIIGNTSEILTSEKVSEILLITQYFDTLRDIGANSKAQAIFIPHSPGAAISDISEQIRNGVMQGAVAQAPSQQPMQLR